MTPPPSNGNQPSCGSLRCARTIPADARCPLTARCSPRGRADGFGHRPRAICQERIMEQDNRES
jgi:hypothetical protein